ncbi:hypothetical protein [Methylobacterium sp. 13MFTsu3.1M2]|nr:hypothetical protein [Methylobacterium sp. 13MFTsu3.1M2]
MQDGGDLYGLSRILRHAKHQMTARCGHLWTEDLHEELERVAERLSRKG